MTNKELSLTIRKELKKEGYTSKDYRIRVKDAGYETAVHIYIINPCVRRSEVEKIVKKFQDITYDERSMEILDGCNTFVFVDYEYGLFDELVQPYMSTAEEIYNSDKWNGKTIAKNDKTAINYFAINQYEKKITEWDGSFKCSLGMFIRCPKDLAIAIWRFKNIGTIYS